MWWDQWRIAPHDSQTDLWVMKSSVTLNFDRLWHGSETQFCESFWWLCQLQPSGSNDFWVFEETRLFFLCLFVCLLYFYGGVHTGVGYFYLFTMCINNLFVWTWPDLNLVVLNTWKCPAVLTSCNRRHWLTLCGLSNGHTDCSGHTSDKKQRKAVVREKRRWMEINVKSLMYHIFAPPQKKNTHTHTLQPRCMRVILLAVVTPTLYWLSGECLLRLLLYT